MAPINPASLHETTRIIADILGGLRQRDAVGSDNFAKMARELAGTASSATQWRSAALWRGPAFHVLLREGHAIPQESASAMHGNPDYAISAYRAWMNNDLSFDGLERAVDLRI